MKKSPFQNLIILTLIVLYITGAGYVVLYGAQFYARMVDESELSLANHSAMLFFNNRLKQHDGPGLITLVSSDGITALCFEQDGYYTLVYELDGNLVEQSSETNTIDPLDTQKILALTDLSYTFEDHGITIRYTDPSGKEITLRYTLIAKEPA